MFFYGVALIINHQPTKHFFKCFHPAGKKRNFFRIEMILLVHVCGLAVTLDNTKIKRNLILIIIL